MRVAARTCRVGLLAAAAFAADARGDFRTGLAAYEAGDFARAFAEWQPLAEQGLVEAQFDLGLLYQTGRGVERDAAAAAVWYERAAEQGYARAQYELATLYESGEGVEEDLVAAFKWFGLAGREKYDDARKRRKRVSRRMTDREIALGELAIREWLRRAKQD